MPGANVEAVVTLRRTASSGPKISEVPGCARIGIRTISAPGGKVLVIPHRRTCNRFDAPPTQIIRLQPCLVASTVILVVPQQQDGCQALINQQIGGVSLPTGA